MYHDPDLAATARSDPRPTSAVSGGVGVAGLVALVGWTVVARAYGLDGPYSALVNVGACALAMVAWSLLVDKVHLNASTGIDWSRARPWRETVDISLTKLAALWATWGAIALIYATVRAYGQGNFAFAMWCFASAAPALFVLSIPYILWLDRYVVEPKDGCWSLGAWMTGQPGWSREAIFAHLRGWGVKAFFLAFMLGGLPGGFGAFVRGDFATILHDPVQLAQWLITFMFLIDMGVATVGYMLTFRPLDSHIRSASPFLGGWVAAMLCYPPTTIMNEGNVLDYHERTASWTWWFAAHPVPLAGLGAVLVALTAVYAWATVAFGPRFSNLTNRGILTHGPYRWTRHPAYLSKNLFWWLSTIPLLSTGSLVDAARATLLMGAVSGVYWWRAKTEERHLMLDPAYRDYSAWMERNAPVPRFFAWVRS